MTISPCAMLMMPMTPNVMARPMAASSSTEPSDRPYQMFCTLRHSASFAWMLADALSAASFTRPSLDAPMVVSTLTASWSPRFFRVSILSSRLTSEALESLAMMAARASSSTLRVETMVSRSSAASMSGSALASRDLKTESAALRRRSGSGDISVSAPRAASSERRTALLRRTRFSAPVETSGATSPVAASKTVPASSV